MGGHRSRYDRFELNRISVQHKIQKWQIDICNITTCHQNFTTVRFTMIYRAVVTMCTTCVTFSNTECCPLSLCASYLVP